MTRHLATFISTDYRDGAFPPIVPAPGLVPPMHTGITPKHPWRVGLDCTLSPLFCQSKPTPYQSLRRPVDNHIVTDSPAGCLPAHVVPFSGFGLSPRSPCCYLLYASQAGVGMGWFPPFSWKKGGQGPRNQVCCPSLHRERGTRRLNLFQPAYLSQKVAQRGARAYIGKESHSYSRRLPALG